MRYSKTGDPFLSWTCSSSDCSNCVGNWCNQYSLTVSTEGKGSSLPALSNCIYGDTVRIQRFDNFYVYEIAIIGRYQGEIRYCSRTWNTVHSCLTQRVQYTIPQCVHKYPLVYQYYKRKRGNCSPQKTRKSSPQTLDPIGVETWWFLAGWFKKSKLKALPFQIFDLLDA